jgi:hypothetical protein
MIVSGACAESIKDLADGLFSLSFFNIRCNFLQRDENKLALAETRVGDLDSGFADLNVTVEQNVEVERAGTVGDGGRSVAAEFFFDRQQAIEQLARRERSFQFDHGIDEARLRGKPHRLGRVKRRAPGDMAQRFNAMGSRSQRRLRRPGVAGQVGAHADVGGMHGFQIIVRRVGAERDESPECRRSGQNPADSV